MKFWGWATSAVLLWTAVDAGAAEPAKDLADPSAKRVALIEGLPVSYRDIGDPDAEALVFIHGAGGILSTGQVGPMLARRYHVLMPSLPGFDETPRGNSRTLADATEVVARFIARVSKPPVYIVGQSLGGRTATWLAIAHPELVRKLVLSAPATLEREPPTLPDDEEAARRMLARWFVGNEEAASQVPAAQVAAQRATRPLLVDYMSQPSREMFLNRMREITAPTLLLWGSKDSLLSPEDGPARFVERIPHVRVEYLNGGHLLPATNAREYVDQVFEFLDTRAPSASQEGNVVAASSRSDSAVAAFQLSSPAFKEGATMGRKHAGATKGRGECDGENISPPLQWTPAPAGTKSFAITMFDPEGRKGLGVSHWVAYGIPADRRSLAEGEANASDVAFVRGNNIAAQPSYLGPCPPFGDDPHHYIFTIIATDLAPGELPPLLTQAALLAALEKHALAAASLVGRYGH